MKYTLLLLAASTMVGCVSGPGVYPTAMDKLGSAYRGSNSGVFAMSSYDRNVLDIGKRNYDNYYGVAGWDRGLFYNGRLRVYRWGANAEIPIGDYAWDKDVGERWHVVRECHSGIPGVSIGTGMNPVKGYYAAKECSLTMVGTAMLPLRPMPRTPNPLPAIPEKSELIDEFIPEQNAPPVPQINLPALTQS